jgi:hypothetical protein
MKSSFWIYLGIDAFGRKFWRAGDEVLTNTGRFHCYWSAWSLFVKFNPVSAKEAA